MHLQGLVEILEAILNLADVYADIWPLDDSPRVLMRVILHYNGGASIGGDKSKFMLDFCDTVLRENASRAIEKETPLSFREAKERWMELAERCQPPSGGQGPAANSNGNRPGAGGARRDGTSNLTGLNRGGTAARSGVCKTIINGQSTPVCFHFNRGACRRTAKGAGCDDGRNGIYAHVCNYWDGPNNKFCLAQHARMGNH